MGRRLHWSGFGRGEVCPCPRNAPETAKVLAVCAYGGVGGRGLGRLLLGEAPAGGEERSGQPSAPLLSQRRKDVANLMGDKAISVN